MYSDFKLLKKAINHNLELNQLRHPDSNYLCLEELRQRIQSISSKLLIFSRFTSDSSYHSLAFQIEEITKKLPKPNDPEMKNKSAQIFYAVRAIEFKTIEIFLRIFSCLSETYLEVENELLIYELDTHLTHKLSYVFEKRILANCHNLDFSTLWNIFLSNFLLNLFQIRDIQFLRNFIKSYLTDENNENQFVDQVKLKELCVLLIENDKNYKFLLKASKAFAERKLVRLDKKKRLNEYSIELIYTSCTHEVLSKSTDYKLRLSDLEASSKGLVNKKCRDDGFITIGNHPFADIELPKVDGNKGILDAVIFWRDSNYYIQDLSKSCSVLKKMKLEKDYEVNRNMVIILSKSHAIRVVETGDFEQDGALWAYLDYEFIEGTYSKVMEVSQESRIRK